MVHLQGMKTSSVEGWQKYLTPGIALFEYFDDDLLPIKPIGIQVGAVLDTNTYISCTS